MPKLLQLNVSANRGSTGKIAEGIGRMAIKHGWESMYVYGRHASASDSVLHKIGSRPYVYLHYAKNRLLDGEGLGSKRPTLQLLKIIADYQPDIVHLHNIHDHWLNYPVLFKYLNATNIKTVWTFHDCWAFTGGCYHFENDNCFKWKSDNCNGHCIQQHFRSAKNFELKEHLFSSLGQNLHIVCVSDWIEKYVSQSFLGRSAGIHTIKNGIDINNVFRPTETIKKKMVIGVANVWPKYKGLNDFLELRKSLPDDIEITLVGLEKKQIKALPEGITGIYRTSDAEELAHLYRQAAVFVNPTYNDTFPTVNLEALACGTPVVTYRTGGSPEAINDDTGIVVERGDINALANSIMQILQNPSQYTSEACRKRAEENFNRDVQFSKYIDLYKSILSK